VAHQSERAGEVKAGEKVVGEQRFSEPNRSAPGGTFEADAGQIDFDLRVFFEMAGGDVLVLGLRAETEPGGGGVGWGVRSVDSRVHRACRKNRLRIKLQIPSSKF